MVPVDLPEDDALRVRAEAERRAFFAIPARPRAVVGRRSARR